ncbi:type VI secretion system contractile sheath small subunit [Alsobacter sp. KACC 23698]|uniref:Type VI secretion system contractile sheath small subunit n=1 Tax=Alsobacter sp. KACC 23698 TaxID=3149229 RepID=A0AAU7JN00_9HYPH
MASDSGQRFIRRNRPPRVHITYENPTNAEEKIELPFVMGVMADLSGNSPGVEKEEIANRKLLDLDMDNFDKRMAAIAPGVTFRVANKLGDQEGEQLGVALRFEKMDDFSPASIAKQVPALNKLLEARTQLANLMRYMDGKVAAESQLKKLLSDPALMAALRDKAPETEPET